MKRSPWFGIELMTDAQFAAFKDLPRTCTKCRRALKVRDFPMTTAYGKLTVRSWCFDCMHAYYVAYDKKRRR